ncbi:MAG TPA: isoprenylcysteine carboxylmethyltransferase family protein [Dehalococcoidia bacterium]|nr:isoprenylcysteine carboxylmethyltransferase family protein [Dehalococcoidia bacterium]
MGLMSIWRHIRAVVLLPGTAAVVIPAVILQSSDAKAGWGLPSVLQVLPFMLGGALLAVGLALFISTVGLFAGTGRGTLAPWDQTQRLVVKGPYRHVRNPMISGVIFVLLAEAALFGSFSILAWALLFALVNMVYIPLSEEPGLESRFGEDYRLYKQHVPRWLPRITPWEISPASTT